MTRNCHLLAGVAAAAAGQAARTHSGAGRGPGGSCWHHNSSSSGSSGSSSSSSSLVWAYNLGAAGAAGAAAPSPFCSYQCHSLDAAGSCSHSAGCCGEGLFCGKAVTCCNVAHDAAAAVGPGTAEDLENCSAAAGAVGGFVAHLRSESVLTSWDANPIGCQGSLSSPAGAGLLATSPVIPFLGSATDGYLGIANKVLGAAVAGCC